MAMTPTECCWKKASVDFTQSEIVEGAIETKRLPDRIIKIRGMLAGVLTSTLNVSKLKEKQFSAK